MLTRFWLAIIAVSLLSHGCLVAEDTQPSGGLMCELSENLTAYRVLADVLRLDVAQAAAEKILEQGVPCDSTCARCFVELSVYFPPQLARRYRAAVADILVNLPEDDPEKVKAMKILQSVKKRCDEDAAIAALLPERPQARPLVGRPSAWSEAILNQPHCQTLEEAYAEHVKTGKKFNFQSVLYGMTGRITCLAEAEVYEGKGRFLSKLDEYLRLFCRQRSWAHYAYADPDRYGNPPGKMQFPDLNATLFAAHLASILMTLGDRLPAETVRMVKREMERRIFQPARREIPMFANQKMGGTGIPEGGRSFLYWMAGHSNWNAVCWDGVVRAALGVLDDPADRAFFVRGALNSIPDYLSGLASDGYCTEGVSYWNYGFGHHVNMGLALREQTNGRLDVFTDDRQRLGAEYGSKFQLAGGLAPPYSDADVGERADTNLLEKCKKIWPDLNQDVGGFSEFPQAQVWLFRNEKSYSISCKGGHNAEIHNHDDVGTYCIMKGGLLAGGDPGCEVYTDRTFSDRRYESDVLNSYGHALPLVGGQMQKEGRSRAAKVLVRDFKGTVKVVSLELRDAYELKALSSLVRTYRYDSESGAVTITDHVVFSEPTSFETAYNTFLEEDNDSFKKNRACIAWGVRPHVTVLSGGEYVISEKPLPNPAALTPRRVGVTFADKVSEAIVEFKYCD